MHTSTKSFTAISPELWHSPHLIDKKWSGRRDSNSRPLAPQASALARLRHGPISSSYTPARYSIANRLRRVQVRLLAPIHSNPAIARASAPSFTRSRFSVSDSFLLFQVQPIIAKIILPWFGGSSAVWSTCMLFFQTRAAAGLSLCPLAAPDTPRAQAGHRAHRAARGQSRSLPHPAQPGWKLAPAMHPSLPFWPFWRSLSDCLISCSPPPARCCRPGTPATTRAASLIAFSRSPTWPPCWRCSAIRS